jgi:hypothetical protein
LAETTRAQPAYANFDLQFTDEDAARFAQALEEANQQSDSPDAGPSNTPDRWTQNLRDFQALEDGQEDQFIEILLDDDERQITAQPSDEGGVAPPAVLGLEDPHPWHPQGSGVRRVYDLVRDPADRTPGSKSFRQTVLRAMGEVGASPTPRSSVVFNSMKYIGWVSGPVQITYGTYTVYDDVVNAAEGQRTLAGMTAGGRFLGGFVGSSAGLAAGGYLLAGGAAALSLTPPGWVAVGVGLTATAAGGFVGGRIGGHLANDLYHLPELVNDAAHDFDESIRDMYNDVSGISEDGQDQPTGYNPMDEWGPLLLDYPTGDASEGDTAPEITVGGGMVVPVLPAPGPEEPAPAPATDAAPPAAPASPAPSNPAPAPSNAPSSPPETVNTARPLTPEDIANDEELQKDLEWLEENGDVQGGDHTHDPDEPEDDEGDEEPPVAQGGEGAMPNPDGDPQPGTGPTYPVYTSTGAGVARPAEGGPIFDIDTTNIDIGSVYSRSNGAGVIRPADDNGFYDLGSFDTVNIYNRPNGAGVINPTPDDIAEPTPRGGTLPTGPGGDPTVMMEGLGRFGLG